MENIYKENESQLESSYIENLRNCSTSDCSPKRVNLSFYQLNENNFINLAKNVSNGIRNYIRDLPLYFQSIKKIPIDIILEENYDIILGEKQIEVNMFMFNLIKYAIDPNYEYPDVSDSALYSISRLLKTDSIQILDLLIKTEIVFNDNVTSFCLRLPDMVESARSEIRIISLLGCISALVGVIEGSEITFFKFFVEHLQNPNQRIRKAANEAAYQIICVKPKSYFAENIMNLLCNDIKQPEISIFFYKALEYQIKLGIFDSLNLTLLNQLISNAFDFPNERKDDNYSIMSCYTRISHYSILVLIAASKESNEICRSLLDQFDKINNLIQVCFQSPFEEDRIFVFKFIFPIINNIALKGPAFTPPIVNLVFPLHSVYYDSTNEMKVLIVRTICLIFLHSQLDNSNGDFDPICDLLIESLNLDNDIVILVIDALCYLKYFNEDLKQALMDLEESDDETIRFFSRVTIKKINEFFAEENFL